MKAVRRMRPRTTRNNAGVHTIDDLFMNEKTARHIHGGRFFRIRL